jgi:hypothetical protein
MSTGVAALSQRWILGLALSVGIGWTQGDGDAKITAAFLDRVETYLQLRQKLESSAPPLPKQATPEQIDGHQQALAQSVRAARSGARPGDLFDPAMTALVKRRLSAVFAGAQGSGLRHEILNEYPGGVTVTVNGRYPDRVPIANMPKVVLDRLPELPDDLEYRFVGEDLILFDPHAHLVIDYIRNALPGG